MAERLQTAVAVQGGALAQVRQTSALRSEAAVLREQQDREYAESMQRDREAREAAERERLIREEEARRVEREAWEQQQAQELQSALELSASLSREKEVAALRSRVMEPEEGAVSASEVSLVRFQLPRGGKLSRRFLRADTIQVLYP